MTLVILKQFVQGRDVFVSLLTGSVKSIFYCLEFDVMVSVKP